MEKKVTSQRASNIELLRIISMFLIVSHHLVVHGVMKINDKSECFQIYEKGTLVNKLLSCCFFPGGEIGVGVFFIITGYFYIKRYKADASRIIVTTIFYGILLTVLSSVLYLINLCSLYYVLITFRTIILPISSGAYWFVTMYVFILLLIPITNQFLQRLNTKGWITLLIYLYIFWFVLGSLGSPFFALQKGLLFYTIGAFYGIHDFKLSKRIYRTFIYLFFLLWILESIIAGGIAFYGNAHHISTNYCLILKTCETAISPFCSTLAFIIFKNINIGSIDYINRIARTTFGIYLLHDSKLLREIIWNKLFVIDANPYYSSWFPLYLIVIPIIIYIFCMSIEFIRIKVFEQAFIQKIFIILSKQLNKLYT